VHRGPSLLALLALSLLVVAVLPSCGHRSAPRSPASWTLTPGALNPAVTQATIRSTICRHGWTATVRPPSEYTDELKREQMRLYRRAGSLHEYQEDHLISLELGGHPTDPRNLWPEPYPRAAAVDSIENQLNAAVCSGHMTLADAQRRESALKHRDG
jgi:hypothetical protein